MKNDEDAISTALTLDDARRMFPLVTREPSGKIGESVDELLDVVSPRREHLSTLVKTPGITARIHTVVIVWDAARTTADTPAEGRSSGWHCPVCGTRLGRFEINGSKVACGGVPAD